MTRVVIALVVLASASVARAEDAEQLYERGQTAFDDKRYAEAHAAWVKSYELSREPALLFNIGQAARMGGDCTTAQQAYRRFLELDRESPMRGDAEVILREMVCEPVPQPLLERANRKRTMGLAFLGGGSVVFVSGLLYGSKARRISNEITRSCNDFGCEWSQFEGRDAEGKRAEALQWVLLGAGTGALVTGGVLYYRGVKERRSLVVTPIRGGGFASWSGTW